MRPGWRAFAVAAAVSGAATTFGCTVLVPSDEVQCATSADCTARGPAFGNAVCVANVCELPDSGTDGGSAPYRDAAPPRDATMSPADDAGEVDGGETPDSDADDPFECLNTAPVLADPTQIVDVQLVLYDAFQTTGFEWATGTGDDLTLTAYAPEVGINVRACTALDPSCDTPASGPVATDDAGVARLMVKGAFTGFYRLSCDGYVPSMFYAGPHLLAGESSLTLPISATSDANYAMLMTYLGVSANTDFDAGPGLISVTQFDCYDRHVPGITFVVSPSADRTLYLETGFPSLEATMTSDEGAAALVNVPAGTATVTSMLGSRTISSESVVVRPGVITYLYLRPRAR
jgi:hypothetical protein